MSVSTVGIVKTQEKSVFVIYEVIKKAVENLYFSHFSDCKVDILSSSKSLAIFFNVKHEERCMSVFFDCESDYAYLTEDWGSQIVILLGKWGSSEIIMSAVLVKFLEELQDCYTCYLIPDDSLEDDSEVKMMTYNRDIIYN